MLQLLPALRLLRYSDLKNALDTLRKRASDWEERLRTKRFSRGRHNDVRFVRWPLDDVRFTAEVVKVLEQQLKEALRQCQRAIVVTHHPPLYALSIPRLWRPMTLDGLLWDAFGGNRAMEELIGRQADRIPFVFCGHTHRARDKQLGSLHGFNIGGDYHFKRLLLLDWPSGEVQAHTFGDPGAS
jgi:hypothetical protein